MIRRYNVFQAFSRAFSSSANTTPPLQQYRTGLKIHNSLTGQKDEFIPVNGRIVNWYTCGPTVYDSSHIGHARNYIAFDIARKIMESYFRYDVRVAFSASAESKIVDGDECD